MGFPRKAKPQVDVLGPAEREKREKKKIKVGLQGDGSKAPAKGQGEQ